MRATMKRLFSRQAMPKSTAKIELLPDEQALPVGERAKYQGYIDERSTHHIAGWLRDLNDLQARPDYEVVLDDDAGEIVLMTGKADAYSPVLQAIGVGKGDHAFRVEFKQPLSRRQRDRVLVRPRACSVALELAPELITAPPHAPRGPFQGYVDERSIRHIAGWARDLSDPEIRLDLEVVLPEADQDKILATISADRFSDVVRMAGVGDGIHAFYLRYDVPLTEVERDRVVVRVTETKHLLELAPALISRFEPIHHVAMDIVNNCNLRCPFCVYDYTETRQTFFMTESTFDAALKLIPYVRDGNFWLSCLHEATLHPQLMTFIERVPVEYRTKLFYTTNLAKRMPDEYFEFLASSGVHNLNVSVESLTATVYEKMRKGARFSIFLQNWNKMLNAFAAGSAPPRIRYNLMAYRSNLYEIPALVQLLLTEKSGWQVEIRNTFDELHIPHDFREEEFLTTAEWIWLAEALKGCDPDRVILLLPPDGKGYDQHLAVPPGLDDACTVTNPNATRPIGRQLSPPFNLRIGWDGVMNVYAENVRVPGQPPTHTDYLVTNINALEDPLATLFAL